PQGFALFGRWLCYWRHPEASRFGLFGFADTLCFSLRALRSLVDGFVFGVTLRHLGLGYSALLKRSV
ncbi:MAG: hypothetical protein J0H02_17405, partial [Armatimonadetes bacterium]|nr:hypothetical protein [Armatimonadota bacterium]